MWVPRFKRERNINAPSLQKKLSGVLFLDAHIGTTADKAEQSASLEELSQAEIALLRREELAAIKTVKFNEPESI